MKNAGTAPFPLKLALCAALSAALALGTGVPPMQQSAYAAEQDAAQEQPSASAGSNYKEADQDGGIGEGFSLCAKASGHSTWTKSNGTASYTDKNGKKVKVPSSKGICLDVSYWNSDGGQASKRINWEKVKAAGVDYAIIRCGYGRNKTYTDDKDWLYNAAQAKAAGVKIGVYLYSYATSTSAAKSEAEHALRCLDDAGLSPSSLALPVYYDVEDPSQTSLSKSKLANICETFCSTVAADGYKVGVYGSQSWWVSKFTEPFFQGTNISRWVARVDNSRTDSGVDNTGLWQFTFHAYVPGLTGLGGKADASFVHTTSFPYYGLAMSSYSKPASTHTYGKSLSVKGTIKSNSKITKVTASIVPVHAPSKEQSCTIQPNKVKVKLQNSYNGICIDKKLAFGKLKPGKYRYQVVVETDGRDTTLLKKTFKVVPAKTAFMRVKAKKGGISVKWAKRTSKVDGYQLRWSTCSNMANAQSATYKKTSRVSKTIKKLQGGVKYYLRVRTYKAYDGVNYCSAWSKAKAVTKKRSKNETSIWITSVANPSTIEQGGSFTIRGKVQTNKTLKSITGKITQKGKTVMSKTVKKKKAKKSYKLAGSAIDNRLVFGKLACGTYTYSISAKAAKKTVTLVKCTVTVK